jgi:hypothetical protein
MPYKGIDHLRRKLASKSARVRERYAYYDMKNRFENFSRLVPKGYDWIRPVSGWCTKSVDSIADRLVFDMFDRDDFEVDDVFRNNSADVFFDSAILSALISACAFVYISPGDDGYPRLQPLDGGNATGELDPTTQLLTEGYAVLHRDDKGKPDIEAYFLPKETYIYTRGEKQPQRYIHTAPFPALVPIIYKPCAKRPFGHSRISRAQMEIVQELMRMVQRSEISAEFYSFPQRYALGMSNGAIGQFDQARARMSEFLVIGKDEDGDIPSLGQFPQQSMSPYIEQLRNIASRFAGETGLTLDDLGFSTANPATEEAIRASHENLRLMARKAQRCFNIGFVNTGYIAACIRDKRAYDRSAFRYLRPVWEPIFEPTAAQLAGVGDAVYKVNEAVPGYIGKRGMKQLTGLRAEDD